MALPQEKLLYTVEQYLAMERAAEERHNYIDGYVIKLAGESLAHSTINVNLLRIISTQLLGKPCRALSPNMKVKSGPVFEARKSRQGIFSYADVSVVCGTPEFHDELRDVLTNPTVIIEILSDSTAGYDLDQKFRRYRAQLTSLQDYVLVEQKVPWIRLYSRQANNWIFTDAAGLEETLYLPSIECRLPLREVYDRVEFAELDEDDADETPES